MLFHIGLENNVEGRSLAWVLDHPGCFAYGENGEFWSPRKLLRRAIWHERDHTNHILQLLKQRSVAPGAG